MGSRYERAQLKKYGAQSKRIGFAPRLRDLTSGDAPWGAEGMKKTLSTLIIPYNLTDIVDFIMSITHLSFNIYYGTNAKSGVFTS